MVYHQAKLSSWDFGFARSPGPGLGNLLFPISRALVGQSRYGGVFVYPTIRQVKIGTYLRMERDKRTYGNVFRTRKKEDWRIFLRALQAPTVAENQYRKRSTLGPVTVAYSGLQYYFHDIEGCRNLIMPWIASNARLKGAIDDKYDIGIHVRLGDFQVCGYNDSRSNTRLPVQWYKDAIRQAQSALGVKTPKTFVFTDGDVGQVKKLLSIPEATADTAKNAVTAIINLSKARVIVASRSTFSMWAVYLGGQAAIWDANFDLNRYFPVRKELDTRI